MKFKEFKESISENIEDLILMNEAEFSMKNLERVSELLARIASKKLGASFQFAWMDKFKKANGDSGIGFRYMSPEGKQIRFNNVLKSVNTFTVNTVDYWEAGDTLTSPSMTINFNEGINIVQLKEQLFEAIKTKKVPSIKYEDLVEASAEEKRTARITFAKNNNIDARMADKYGNAWLSKQAAELGLEKEYADWMKISLNVSEKTEFDSKIREDEKQLGPSGIYADPEYVFQDMEQAALVVAKGKWRSCIIAGDGGLGKTYGVKQVLTNTLGAYGEGPDAKWAFYEGLKTTAFGLFKILLLNKKKLIVFDDSDSIWGDKDIINMMKIVTSDSGDRSINWASNSVANVSLMSRDEREAYEYDYLTSVMEDPNTLMKPPSTFNFEGSMINISNMPAEKFDNAIKSRAIFINLYMAQRDVLRRMATIKRIQGRDDATILKLLKALEPDAEDALTGKGKYAGEVKYITPEDARKNKKLNMRSLDIAEALMDAGAKDWERMAALYA